MNLNNKPIIEELICICVEKNTDNYNNLCRVIEERLAVILNSDEGVDPDSIQFFKAPSITDLIEQMRLQSTYRNWSQKHKNQTTKLFIINDEFEKIILAFLKEFQNGEQGGNLKPAPGFYFIDPYGFHGIPFKIIKNILKLPKSEVLLTFMSRDINRFNPLEQEEDALVSLFGNKDWKTEMNKRGEEGQEVFVNYYRDCLKNNGIKYVIKFKIGETGRKQSLYYLIHASNDFAAADLMKETMYYVNPDYAYHGPDHKKLDRNQTRLDVRTHPLREQILNLFQGRSVTFEQIRIDTIDTNILLRKTIVLLLRN